MSGSRVILHWKGQGVSTICAVLTTYLLFERGFRSVPLLPGRTRQRSVTLPLIYALENAGPAERQLVETVLADRSYTRVPFAAIFCLIEGHGGVERARQRASGFTGRAGAIIAEFPDSPCQRALATLTGLVTERDH